jgi:hypothetical protein
MQALVQVSLPFDLLVPDGAEYQIHSITSGEYQVAFDVPIRSARPVRGTTFDQVRLNGDPAFLADFLQIRFFKEEFDRRASAEMDPPSWLISFCIEYFLGRLRYVAKAPHIRSVDFPHCDWRLRYLSNDGTELDVVEGLVRGRGVGQIQLQYVACHPAVWEDVFSLPSEFVPPAWRTLLLDALGALPHIGSAVVLAATAHEVFIAEVLNQLAAMSDLPGDLWEWITDRGNFQKEPSVEEQFDTLLRVFTGHGLKESPDLWKAFKDLRSARNTFAHTGVAKIGKSVLSVNDAARLLQHAEEIPRQVRSWIPTTLRWPEFEHPVELKLLKVLAENQSLEEDADE